MLLKKDEKKRWLIGLAVVILALTVLGFLFMNKNTTDHTGGALDTDTEEVKTTETAAERQVSEKDGVHGTITVKPDIDYQDLQKDTPLKELMTARKKELGMDKSLDMIVRSDETFKVGDHEVSMQDILKQLQAQKGEIHTQTITESGAVKPQSIKSYGIYVVQPNDNIWNIHFNILKEYYEKKGINVSPKADEPSPKGLSSGVGKILKFSETMVIIYSLADKKVAADIDLIEPLSKIVVYNMEEVFALLSKINYENIDRIQFDGKTIWIPAKK